MKGRVFLNLWGQWNASIDDGALRLKSQKAKAIVSYLVLAGSGAAHRDDIAQMFWPGSDRRKTRASLRQALTEIRNALGRDRADVLNTSGDFVSLRAEAFALDVLESLNALGQRPLLHDEISKVRRIGELLREFEGVAPRFDDWLRDKREELRGRFVEKLESVCTDLSVSAKDRLKAAMITQELDAFNETAVRTLMECHVILNEAASAIRTYNEFYNRLDEELGAEPAIETQNLAARIKLASDVEAPGTSLVSPGAPNPARTLVAVLPFAQLGPVEMPDYIALGLLDNITCKMAALQSPGVISSNSTRGYVGTSPSIREVGQRLKVRYVVTGSVQTMNGTSQISVQLCDCNDERVVWGRSIELPTREIFDFGLVIADDIARALEPSLNIAELDRSRSLDSENLEPHHLVLQAKDLMFKLQRNDFEQAKTLLDSALQRGPHFGPAHSLTAEWYIIDLLQGWTNDPAYSRMALEEHSRRAIQYSPGDGRAVALWGHNKIAIDRDYDGAIRLFDRALDLSPNDAETLIWTVPTLALSGDSASALLNAEKSFELSPMDPFLFRNEHFASLAHYAHGNFEEAARLGLSCFKKTPNYSSNLRVTIASLAAAGRAHQARELVLHHGTIEPNFSAREFKERHGFKEPERRAVFVEHLMDAGISE